MSLSILQIKLNNIRLNQQMNTIKLKSKKYLDDKNKAKELILEYKNALEQKEVELTQIKKEKTILENKYNKIPEFVRNFFGE